MKIILLVTCLGALLVAGAAHSQVTYQSGTTTGALEGATVSGTVQVRLTDCTAPPWYFWIDRTSGEATTIDFACPIDITIDTRSLAEGAHFVHARNDPGARIDAAFTVRNATAPVVAMPPKCWPWKFRWAGETIPPDVATRYTKSLTWPCDFPSGYSMWTLLWGDDSKTAEVAGKAARKELTVADANAMYIAGWGGPLNTSESDYIARRNAAFQPLAVVSLNGTLSTRPVYAALCATPNGPCTRNTAYRTERVAIVQNNGIPTRCDWRKRLVDSTGNRTSYFSVQGVPNAATPNPDDVLGDLYAVCSVTLPLGAN